MTFKIPKKLIEVALPLDDINTAATREKSIRHGHPSTLHLWWARRPLAVARAVIFAQMVNDPGYERSLQRGVNKKEAEQKREALFQIIRDLVKWENTNNETVLAKARAAIWDSWRETCDLNKNHPQASELFNPEKLPAFHDPFAGGGALPLEAQRLGLESYASDLNPVAVMINKAMIEIPPKFAGRAPVGALPEGNLQTKLPEQWTGAQGLAEDVRRYGHWMREQAFERIGHLYPQVDITTGLPVFPKTSVRGELVEPQTANTATVIAWLWARTVKSPNPAFSHVDVPLISTFILSSKAGKEAYIEPIIDGDSYRFEVRMGELPASAKNGTSAGKRGGFLCLLSGSPMDYNYIRAEGKAGRMEQKLMAIVAEGNRGRIYLAPTTEMETIAAQANPEWRPETKLPDNPRDFKTPNYGMHGFGDLFTPRQLIALTTFSDVVQEARVKVFADAIAHGMTEDGLGLAEGGMRAAAYADAVAVYLGLAVSRTTNTINALAVWSQSREQSVNLFSRQAIPMVWDFPEVNPFAGAAGDFGATTTSMAKTVAGASSSPANVIQADAQTQSISQNKVISTDPPYYDNIGYADLSDFFYVWLRRALRPVYPELFATVAVPKAEELVATPYRHGSKEKAEKFFLDGMTEAMHRLAEQAHPAFPVTIYYAFKQSDTTDKGTGNTGWETFLAAVLQAGFVITGTWPMRTERPTGVKIGMNALASSIVLVCQKRDPNAETISRRQLLNELRDSLPIDLEAMIGGTSGQSPIAPVDLAQAAIGPGMAIFSRYAAVLNQDGSLMTVHDALILINRHISDYLNPNAGTFDNDSLFCCAWFEQYGWSAGLFGEADTLSRAKGSNVEAIKNTGLLVSGGGSVRLCKWG